MTNRTIQTGDHLIHLFNDTRYDLYLNKKYVVVQVGSRIWELDFTPTQLLHMMNDDEDAGKCLDSIIFHSIKDQIVALDNLLKST